MAEEGRIHLALFTDVYPATQALDKLRELGISDKNIAIVSGVPYSDRILGRPKYTTRVPRYSIVGFVGGFILSILLNWGTPYLYPIHVGGQPLYSVPPTILITFELSMLGLILFTFLGVLFESDFPSLGPKVYHPEISNGKVAVEFDCPPEIHTQVHEALAALGAEWVHRTEAKQL